MGVSFKCFISQNILILINILYLYTHNVQEMLWFCIRKLFLMAANSLTALNIVKGKMVFCLRKKKRKKILSYTKETFTENESLLCVEFLSFRYELQFVIMWGVRPIQFKFTLMN